MGLKFTEELCVVSMNNDAKLEEELTCHYKIYMRNVTNFELSTQKPQKSALSWASLDQSIKCLS